MNGQQYDGPSTEITQSPCGTLTLDPLSTHGQDALDTHDVPGLDKATLCELEILSRNRAYGVTVRKANDLFAPAGAPPLRAIIGSLTTSIAITLGGVALMILPTLVVGNEPLILGGVALAVGAWFLAHRHGHLRGQLAAAASPVAQAAKPAVSQAA